MKRSATPTLRVERRMLRDGMTAVASIDEVGRGALCGPVTVGAVIVTESTRTAPQGVRDSKLLSAQARERLVPKIQRWADAFGVGHATPDEIDQFGIMAALRLAGHRALAQLNMTPDIVLLDGNHDYLSFPDQIELIEPPRAIDSIPPVDTMIKADLRCASVAAASILAKTARDAIMIEAAQTHPEYGWAGNKGYAAPDHLAALALHGPTEFHRRSWNLPGVGASEGPPVSDPVVSDAVVSSPVLSDTVEWDTHP